MNILIFIQAIVLSSRASDLCEAAQQCSGVGRWERGVPLCGSRRPCSHYPLEKRRFWPAEGQVIHKGPLHAVIYHANMVFRLLLSSLDCVCPSCLQIWNPRGPYLDSPPSDLFRWGLLYMRGRKHGWEVWSICHAHCTRSVHPNPRS